MSLSVLTEEFDLHDIDSIDIKSEFDPQRTAAKIGLICTLYVSNPHQVDVRRKLAACGDEYIRWFRSELRLFQGPSGEGRYNRFPDGDMTLMGFLDENEPATSPLAPFTPSFSGSENVRDAASHSLVVSAPGTRFFAPGEVSGSLSVSIPVGYVLDQSLNSPTPKFQDMVHGWCERLGVESGYAGLGFIQSVDPRERTRTIQQISKLALRFPGLEVDDAEVVGNHIGNGIKGVNWLTIVCNRWLDRIGGRKRIGSQLDESSTSVREYRDGLIIQAGPSPQIGDRNRNNLLDPYRDVARLLKPLRMHFPEMQSLLDLGDGRETEVTNEWLARFD